ncbi:oxidoreductase [Microbulbifer celer]|uniref:Oxidoreductase n=1 Tax=Microbulbifer celer TaxID=435905 RepID=A0ABW3U494_9GAMM|nr:oxidoreductase [Microbulbifer celer]UFN56215.1 oxidoreductase [Microbulbifer celer]
MNQPIKAALIGLGFSGRTFHLPFLQSRGDYELIKVVSGQSELAKKLVPEAEVVPSMEDLSDTDVELAIITAPNELHFPLAEAALKAGLHVVLEKPFVNTVGEGEALVQLADEHQRVLSVYHNRRFDGDFLTVQALLENQTLGTVRLFESHFDRFRPEPQVRWREQAGPGTGFLYDLGSHLIDQALVLFGWPETITANVLAMRPHAEVADYFHLQLGYAAHQVILHSSPFCASPNHRFQLHGSKGSYQKWGLDPQEDRLRAGIRPDGSEWGKEETEQYGSLYVAGQRTALPTQTGNYHRYYDALYHAIRSGGEPPVTARQALDVVRLIELAERSAVEGRTLSV